MARPVIAAVQEQQEHIERLTKTSAKQDSDLLSALGAIKSQQEQIKRLTAGLQHLSRIAGLEHHVASAMGLRFVQADVQNPAEPVPEPPAVPAVGGTVQTKTPEAFADVTAPGLVPGSTNDVAADATTTNYTPGEDIAAPAFRNLQDVTAPIEGTQTQRPLSETRTEHDVRVGDPMNPQTAFPMTGPFQQAQRTARKTAQQEAEERSNRTMASLRLARLRISAGLHEMAPGTENADLELSAAIAKDAALSTQAIEQEIATLTAVRDRQRQTAAAHNPSLVPRTAARRQAPPMSGAGRSAVSTTEDATDLFLS